MRLVILLLIGTFGTPLLGQNRTLGSKTLTQEAKEGFTLFAPNFSKSIFLIDNCGYEYKRWTATTNPGLSCHLLPNGHLLRAGRIPGSFTGGGVGGRVEILDAASQVLWRYDVANDSMHQHHIAHPMPNGNILLAVWKKYSQQHAESLGFLNVPVDGLISDAVLEIKPIFPDKIEIIWQWDFIDHIIQDNDPSKPNYGLAADYPEKLDVDFSEDPGGNKSEWIHLNAIDYNEKLDQLILSSKYHNEFYIIDHSTTIAEASSSAGGRYGQGGDFLYRWGNPRSYGRGTRDDHHLYGQHGVRWIADSLPGAGNVLLFNNGSNRDGIKYATVEELVLPYKDDGSYHLKGSDAYEPRDASWIYPKTPDQQFYSSRMSGAQRLKNGNTIACVGNKGRFLEVTQDGNVTWDYVNPVNAGGPGIQGNGISNNDVFATTKYNISYPGIVNLNIQQGSPLELYPNSTYDCSILTSCDDLVTPTPSISIDPFNQMLYINYNDQISTGIIILNAVGHSVLRTNAAEQIDISNLKSGFYILQLTHENYQKTTLSFVKM